MTVKLRSRTLVSPVCSLFSVSRLPSRHSSLTSAFRLQHWELDVERWTFSDSVDSFTPAHSPPTSAVGPSTRRLPSTSCPLSSDLPPGRRPPLGRRLTSDL
jgi:hypothetical protein